MWTLEIAWADSRADAWHDTACPKTEGGRMDLCTMSPWRPLLARSYFRFRLHAPDSSFQRLPAERLGAFPQKDLGLSSWVRRDVYGVASHLRLTLPELTAKFQPLFLGFCKRLAGRLVLVHLLVETELLPMTRSFPRLHTPTVSSKITSPPSECTAVCGMKQDFASVCCSCHSPGRCKLDRMPCPSDLWPTHLRTALP